MKLLLCRRKFVLQFEIQSLLLVQVPNSQNSSYCCCYRCVNISCCSNYCCVWCQSGLQLALPFSIVLELFPKPWLGNSTLRKIGRQNIKVISCDLYWNTNTYSWFAHRYFFFFYEWFLSMILSYESKEIILFSLFKVKNLTVRVCTWDKRLAMIIFKYSMLL